jgi:hypothetical protein
MSFLLCVLLLFALRTSTKPVVKLGNVCRDILVNGKKAYHGYLLALHPDKLSSEDKQNYALVYHTGRLAEEVLKLWRLHETKIQAEYFKTAKHELNWECDTWPKDDFVPMPGVSERGPRGSSSYPTSGESANRRTYFVPPPGFYSFRCETAESTNRMNFSGKIPKKEQPQPQPRPQPKAAPKTSHANTKDYLYKKIKGHENSWKNISSFRDTVAKIIDPFKSVQSLEEVASIYEAAAWLFEWEVPDVDFVDLGVKNPQLHRKFGDSIENLEDEIDYLIETSVEQSVLSVFRDGKKVLQTLMEKISDLDLDDTEDPKPITKQFIVLWTILGKVQSTGYIAGSTAPRTRPLDL